MAFAGLDAPVRGGAAGSGDPSISRCDAIKLTCSRCSAQPSTRHGGRDRGRRGACRRRFAPADRGKHARGAYEPPSGAPGRARGSAQRTIRSAAAARRPQEAWGEGRREDRAPGAPPPPTSPCLRCPICTLSARGLRPPSPPSRHAIPGRRQRRDRRTVGEARRRRRAARVRARDLHAHAAGDRIHLAFASVDGDAAVSTRCSCATRSSVWRHAASRSMPTCPLATGEMTARLAGGPVSLAVLGVKEGMKGLTDVARRHGLGQGAARALAMAPTRSRSTAQVALRSISLKQPRIAPEPLRGIDFSVSARGVLDDRRQAARRRRAARHGRAPRPDARHGRGVAATTSRSSLAIDVAPAACQALLDSTPQGLLPTVRSARMGGTFGARHEPRLRHAHDREARRSTTRSTISAGCSRCRATSRASASTASFTYRTYQPDGTIGETTTGPGTPDLDEPRRHQPVHGRRGPDDRGRRVLQASRLQPRGDPLERAGEPEGPSLRSRREHDHDAAREEPLPRARQGALAEDRGGDPDGLPRAGLPQGRHDGALSQRRRVRSRRVRDHPGRRVTTSVASPRSSISRSASSSRRSFRRRSATASCATRARSPRPGCAISRRSWRSPRGTARSRRPSSTRG